MYGDEQSDHAEYEISPWEILLDITLVIMMFLGFRASVEENTGAAVARKLARIVKSAASIQGTTSDQWRRRTDLALQDVQYLRLLNAWTRIREGRILFQVRSRLLSPDSDMAALPPSVLACEPSFMRFREQVRGLFLSSPDATREQEALIAAMSECFQHAAQTADIRPPDPDCSHSLPSASEEALRGMDTHARISENQMTAYNARRLMNAIRGDFTSLRRDVEAIQVRIVADIDTAKINVDEREGDAPTAPGEVLDHILKELVADFALLPEVCNRWSAVR